MAVFLQGGQKDSMGPIQLVHDLVVVDVYNDGGKDAPRLANELLRQGRRVFVIATTLPRRVLFRLLKDYKLRSTKRVQIVEGHPPMVLVEIALPAG